MRIIMDPIQMVARFDTHGNPSPARFQHGDKVINVEQILRVSEEKLAGNRMKICSCQSEIAGKMTRYELKFELATCKWFFI